MNETASNNDTEGQAVLAGKQHHLLTRADIEAMPAREHVHQFNSNAVRITQTLSDATGLTTLGVHLIRLPPGRDSTTYHFHDGEEEFLYVCCRGTESRRLATPRTPLAQAISWAFHVAPQRTCSATHLLPSSFTSWVVSAAIWMSCTTRVSAAR